MAGSLTVSDRGYRDLMRRMRQASRGKAVVVGVLDGDQPTGGGLTLGELAAVLEFGSTDGHIPERSFIRAYIDENRTEIEAELRAITAKVIAGTLPSMDQGLRQLGAKMEAEIADRIRAGISPENAPSTVERKGSSTPLIASGGLVEAIASELRAFAEEVG